jgi:hypothetical protein
MKRASALKAFLCLASLAAASAQSAAIINDVADDFIINWSYSPVTGSTASAIGEFDVTSISATQLVMNVKLTNTSTGFINAGITSFGFNVSPNATGVSANTFGANDTGTDADKVNDAALGNLPAIAAIDICFYSANNCNGGSQANLLGMGEIDYFTITITGNFPGASVSFLDLVATNAYGGTGLAGIKFQTDLTSYEFIGSTPPPDGGDDPLPVPGVVALLGLGLLGLVKRHARK